MFVAVEDTVRVKVSRPEFTLRLSAMERTPPALRRMFDPPGSTTKKEKLPSPLMINFAPPGKLILKEFSSKPRMKAESREVVAVLDSKTVTVLVVIERREGVSVMLLRLPTWA